MIYRIGRASRHIIIVFIVFAALALTAIRLLLPQVRAYRADLETEVGKALGAPVKIGSLRAHISGFRPELVIADIQVASAAGGSPAIQLKEIHLGVNLLESLFSRRFLSAMQVSVVGAKLSVIRKIDGSLSITGLKSGGDAPLWLLQAKRYAVLQSEVEWHDQKAGAKPLTFKDVDIVVDNDHAMNRRRVHVLLALPEGLGHSLRLSLDARSDSDIFLPGGWNGRVYAEGKKVNLSALSAEHLPANLQSVSGVADFKLWSEWDKSKLSILFGNFRFTEGKLLNEHKEALAIDNFGAKFVLRRAENDWRLQVKDIDLDVEDMHWRSGEIGLYGAVGGEKQSLQHVGIAIPHLKLAAVSRLVLYFRLLPKPQAQLLQQLEPTGTVQNFAAYLEPDIPRYTFRGEFADLAWSPFGSVPAVTGLSGAFKGSDAEGVIQLSMQPGQIEFPELFRSALPVSRFFGSMQWQQTAEFWQFSSEMLELDTPDLATQNRVLLQIPKGSESVFIDLQSSFRNGHDVAQIKKYLPAGVIDADVLRWLDRAFVAGKVNEGQALLRGKLKDFPFDKHEGVFQVLFSTQGLELGFHPDWPNITGIDADVRFLQGALQVDLHSGKSEEVQIRQATAVIESLQDSPYVWLKGSVGGDLRQGLKYLRSTPLRSTVDPVMQFIAVQGAGDADLDLRIPIAENVAPVAEGIVHLRNAQLQVLPLNVAVDAIHGDLKFTESGLYAQKIVGRAFGNQVAANIARGGGQTVVTLNGQVAAKDLATSFPSEYWRTLKGQSDYKLRLAFPGIDKQPASLQLTTNLQGLAADWPGTLGKSALQVRTLNAEFGFPDGQLLPVTINYGDELRAALYVDKQTNRLFSANILLMQRGGKAQAELTTQPGITLSIVRPDFEIDPWLRASDQSNDEGFGVGALQALSLDTKHFRWQNNDLGEVKFALRRRSGRWEGAVNSRFAAGKVSLPASFKREEKIQFEMEMLNLSPLADLRLQGEALSPLNFPGLQLDSRKLYSKSADLGELSLRAQPSANGLEFSAVELHSKQHNLLLTGHWQASGKQSFSDFKGTLRSAALGELLAQLDITQDMQQTPGQIDFSLRWPGAPYQASFADIQGIADADLGEGRLLGVNPGIGRILGILALDQWKRRLQLDFSDAYAEGLTYNRISGHFEIAGGYALTDNLTIEAVPAKIEIKGKTGLAARDWNQVLVVTPKTSAALPIAGTIASKLITGAVSLVANQEVVDDLKHINSAAYQVKGKWGAAEIKPLHESDGLLRKVWTGMTDFSWLK